jgi:hypothetical protein
MDGVYSNIYSLLIEGDTIWVGNYYNLSRYNLQDDSWFSTPIVSGASGGQAVTSIISDGRYLWAGGTGYVGLCKYDKVSNTYQQFITGGVYGVPSSNVKDIDIDSTDVWVATSTALGRYNKIDGSVTVFTKENTGGGLPSNDVLSVKVDGQYIWVGTVANYTNSLSRYDKISGTWRVFTRTEMDLPTSGASVDDIKIESNYVYVGLNVWYGQYIGKYNKSTDNWELYSLTGTISSLVRNITIDSSSVWIMSQTSGLVRYEKGTGQFSKIDGLLGNTILSLATDGKHLWIADSVWVGTNAGLNLYDITTEEWEKITLPAVYNIEDILVDGNYVWIATGRSGRVLRLHKPTQTWTQFSFNTPNALALDGDYIWVGGINNISRYDKRTSTWTSFSTSYTIKKIISDGDNVWFTCYRTNKVMKYNKITTLWETLTFSSEIYSLAVDGDNVLFGGGGSGPAGIPGKVQCYNKVTGVWSEYDVPENLYWGTQISDIFIEPDYIWYGENEVYGGTCYSCASEIVRYTRSTGLWWSYKFPASSQIRSIARSGKYVFCGTNRGLYRFNNPTPTSVIWEENIYPVNVLTTEQINTVIDSLGYQGKFYLKDMDSFFVGIFE